ncbi:MAG: TrkH family potassium uptake protein [Spirochaetales bacterium]
MIIPFLRLISMLLMITSVTMFLPVGVAFATGEHEVISSFLIPILFCWVVGPIVLALTRHRVFKLTIRGGFGAVALSWIFASLIGAIPFMISGSIPSFDDALFESVSGFTTTGASILSNPEFLPRSINLWRSQMHWLGGMGIVALTVALLPLLGVGGFQLIKAETTGPEKGKITPKITMTAKILWFIYLGFTVIQTILLMFAGMDFIDAISHTFATLGTGGFSSRVASVGSYNAVSVDVICTVFMFLAGINFSLYYYLIIGNGKEVLHNTELKAYVGITAIAILGLTVFILPMYGSFTQALQYASFQAVSVMTTTGFVTADYSLWVPAAQMILFLLMFVGGCTGSTGGSIKVLRWVILAKQMKLEMKRMLHPHGVFSIQLNNRVGRKDVVYSVAAFIFLYFMMVLITGIVASLNGADLLTSFSASLALVGNIGPGFGDVGPTGNYAFFHPIAKYWFSFAMIAGRLELYTMVIFFTAMYWKK